MSDDIEITQEVIEAAKARDVRIAAIDRALDIEQDLRSPVITLLMGRIKNDAHQSLEALASVDPTDTKNIVLLQAKVYMARLAEETINAVLLEGLNAERSLSETGLDDHG